MPSAPKTGPVAVPEALWPDLWLAWPSDPGSDVPGGYLGIGPAMYVGAPHRYALPQSMSPPGGGSVTVAVTCVVSTHPGATQLYVPFSTTRPAFTGGFHLEIASGKANWYVQDDTAGGPTLTASLATGSGILHHLVGVQNRMAPEYAALYRNGTLVASTSITTSFTQQNTCNIGWGLSDPNAIASCDFRHLYVFGRALTAVEVRQLAERVS